jgi:hypothetical protein
MTEPHEIVKAFDECLDLTFGRALGRDNPHKDDAATAQQWLNAGATIVICVMVFTREMAWMHEKYLRSGRLRDRQFIPHSLKIFEDNILSAIRTAKSGSVDVTDKVDSLWRSRIAGWCKNQDLWRHEMWGPAPNETGCRAPKSILIKMEKHSQKCQALTYGLGADSGIAARSPAAQALQFEFPADRSSSTSIQ